MEVTGAPSNRQRAPALESPLPHEGSDAAATPDQHPDLERTALKGPPRADVPRTTSLGAVVEAHVMTAIIGIAGSLRRGSYNARLLRACAALAPRELEIGIASIAEVPLYDGDVEREQGVPGPVAQLKDEIARAQGLLLVSPEYNNSMPGVLKNAIDWLSRPPADIPRVFRNKPVALLGATPGRGGTRLAQAAWLPVFRTLGMRLWTGKQLYVAGAGEVFAEDGEVVDEAVRRLLTEFVAGFAEFVAGTPRP